MAKPGQPSRKFFIRDLMLLELLPSLLDTSIKEWRLKTAAAAGNASSRGSSVKFVWLQGTVVQCQSADTFTLVDGTGTALVGGCSKIPPVCPRPRHGRYLMVIGELKASGEVPAVKAFKIQDLSDSDILRQMWPMEVLDMDNFYNS